MKSFFTVCGLCLFLHSVGQVSYSNDFLNIGVGARALGMSGAVVASAHDINASYWNPAGLSHIDVPLQIGAMHSEWFGGVGKYDHLALSRSLNTAKKSVASLSMIRLAIDQIPNTLNLVAPDGSIRFDNVGEFSAVDYAFLLSYATGIGTITEEKSLHGGATIKILHRLIGPFATAWGFGIDAGLQIIRPTWQFGVTGHDLSTTFTGWNYTFTEEQKIVLEKTGNIIPVSTLEKTLPRLAAGFLYKFNFKDKFTLQPELGFNIYFDGKRNTPVANKVFSLEPKLGVELGYQKLVFLRIGYGNIQKIKDELNLSEYNTRGQLNTGLGVRLGKKVSIDYALSNIGNLAKELNYSHIFSATLDISKD